MESESVKLVVFVPESHADIVRAAIGDAGGGRLGLYSHCSFSIKGKGRFTPMEGAHPSIGTVGTLETVDEERIEVLCRREDLGQIIAALKNVHPYEEVPIEIYDVACG